MQSITDGVKNGLNDLGNESMFPLIEYMNSLGWNPLENPNNKTYVESLLDNLETDFKLLYNINQHQHQDLYNALVLLNISSISDGKLFEHCIIRDPSGKMTGFTDRFKELLLDSSQGLNKVLNLRTDCQELKIKAGLLPPTPEKRFSRSYENDAICKKIIENELYNDNQQNHLANLITNQAVKKLKNNINEGINSLKIINSSSAQEYNELIATIQGLVESLDNSDSLKHHINLLAKLDIVKNNQDLREYLGKALFIANPYQDISNILESPNTNINITDFKPDLINKAQNMISFRIFDTIKSDFSKRIYNNDFLIERYLPANVRGIRTNEVSLRHEIQRNLDILQNHNATDLIIGRIVEDYRQQNPNKNLPPYSNAQYNINTVAFQEIFYNDSDSLHKLLTTTQLIKNIGMDNYVRDIFRKTPKEGIAQLCQDWYNMGRGDKVYTMLSNVAGESIDLNTVLVIRNNKAIGIDQNKLDEILISPGSDIELLNNMLLDRVGKTNFDLQVETYRYNHIHTKQSMMINNNAPSYYANDRINRLFRNHIETKQHERNSPGRHEAGGEAPQVGDTHHSNESYTIIPDIAVIYSMYGSDSNPPHYSWIEINSSTLGINTTEYIEYHRTEAQEFVTVGPNPDIHLGAVKVEAIRDVHNNITGYKIVDGYLNQGVYEKIRQGIIPTEGIEDKTLFFLQAAYKHQEASINRQKLDDREISQLTFESDDRALQHKSNRTNYQSVFDNKIMPSTWPNNVPEYVRALRWHKLENDRRISQYGYDNYYTNLSIHQHRIEQQYMAQSQKSGELKTYKQVIGNLQYIDELDRIFHNFSDQDLENFIKRLLTDKAIILQQKNKLEQMNYAISKLYEHGKDINYFEQIIDDIPKGELSVVSLKEFVSTVENKINSRLKPEIQQILQKNNLEIAQEIRINDPFLSKLETALEFVDTPDLMIQMRSDSSTPWRAYQASGQNNDEQLDNWLTAKNLQYQPNDRVKSYKELYETLTTEQIAGDLPARNYPITAGGAYNINGVIEPDKATYKSSVTQYFPISEQDLANLKKNKFITILEAHKVNNPNLNGNFLCKYRYPDVRDSQGKLAHYMQNIDPSIQQEINDLMNTNIAPIAYSAGLHNINDPTKLKDLSNEDFLELTVARRELQEISREWNRLYEPDRLNRLEQAYNNNPAYQKLIDSFEKLNEKFISNVLQQVLEDDTLTPFDRYQSLISLHALPDMNGRSNRMFYQKESGRPFYMMNFDQDITTTNIALENEYRNYTNIIGAFHEEFIDSTKNNKTSEYYNNPKVWLASFGIEPSFYNKIEAENLRKNIWNVIDRQDVRDNIRSKNYGAYYSKIMQAIYSSPDFKLLSMQDKYQNSALHQACMYNRDLDKLFILADKQGIDITKHKNTYGQTPIHLAAMSYNFNAIEKCLTHTADIKNITDNNNKTFYNNLMENIASADEYSFQNFLVFSEQVLNKHGFDITQYVYPNDNRLADVLIINGKLDKAKLLIIHNPSFPLKEQSLTSIINNIDNSTDLNTISDIIKTSNSFNKESKHHLEDLVITQRINLGIQSHKEISIQTEDLEVKHLTTTTSAYIRLDMEIISDILKNINKKVVQWDKRSINITTELISDMFYSIIDDIAPDINVPNDLQVSFKAIEHSLQNKTPLGVSKQEKIIVGIGNLLEKIPDTAEVGKTLKENIPLEKQNAVCKIQGDYIKINKITHVTTQSQKLRSTSAERKRQ